MKVISNWIFLLIIQLKINFLILIDQILIYDSEMEDNKKNRNR